MGKQEENEMEVYLENSEELDELGYESCEDYVFKQIRVSKKDFSIYELCRKYSNDKLILDVDFQRKNVWDEKQKCELIESILMGLPLPIFYFKQLDDAKYVVVDGKQRLSALFDFMKGEFKLKNLKILTHLNNKYFSQLTGEFGIYQSQLEDYQVYSHLILPPTPDKILFDIFDRVNRGGTKLNKQEIRNALYQGDGLAMINELVETEEFYNATGICYTKDSRMKGAYLLTRYLTFSLYFGGRLNAYQYNGDIDGMIEKALKYLNKCNINELETINNETKLCLRKSQFYFGRGAFRKFLNQSNPINMNIFETTMYLMEMINGENMGLKNILVDKMYKVIDSDMYLDSIGNGRDGSKKVSIRFTMMNKIIEEIYSK